MVSHELKTPLTSLGGYTQMLQMHARKNDDTFAKDKLDKVIKQVKKMSTLINGFLNVSRLESGKIHLNKQPFELGALIREIIEDAESSMSSHRLVFEQACQALVSADRDKIGTVLYNLISNAIKYSPKANQVLIKCQVENQSVTVSIRDDGMGIKPDELGKLFDRYYRVESNQMKHISGFGIGLYLSSEIITRHEGTIWAESQVGLGSTFYISLPLAQ